MKRSRLITFLLIISLCWEFAPAPARADQLYPASEPIIGGVLPRSRTQAVLLSKSIDANWYEDRLEITESCKLANPTAKKLKLPMSLAYQGNEESPTGYEPYIQAGDATVPAQFNGKTGSFNWELHLLPGEEVFLSVKYVISARYDREGLNLVRFPPPVSGLWANQPAETTVTLNLEEIHPGQIVEIQPLSFQFGDRSLSWTLSSDLADGILVKADVFGEKKEWERLIPHNDRLNLAKLNAKQDYLGAAELFRVKALTADRQSKTALKEVQGYYLEKAGQPADALAIWQDLYDEKVSSARVYWSLAQAPQKQNGKILELYQRVREMQINPLLQSWLASRLPPANRKPGPPDNPQVAVNTDSSRAGLFLKVKVNDKDGDLEKLVFKYHWEDQATEEVTINAKPFSYEHNASLFIPAPGPLKRLFYEVIAFDRDGHKSSTSEKEDFYLNNQLNSQLYPLRGAVLVLADYSPSEYDKVDKWFRSYIRIAYEANFVPIEQRRPYFIFLGQNHDFIAQYQGPLFIMHTPAPFDPDLVRLSVHRYFLSYWYGPGWSTLPEGDLAGLGDALMLGRGKYVMVLKYLTSKDPQQFAALLAAIGQGKGWQQSLSEVFQMNIWEAQIRAVWFAYGNMVLAVFIILSFAWLGKTGQITRLIACIRDRSKP